ncbi:hypothetical protein CERSUDRAFT_114227 [Gelatoporia subvermispora B]|uniref:DUF1793-domain-containing protein n=1 Tax=Ceriporiopsis subvermispora (strain B) TaxID=914234 RepID=M2QKN3_CERS8|nr:hypothetical protein CERSUDRAFT_114227 [Gelatoporia subvermispora B]
MLFWLVFLFLPIALPAVLSQSTLTNQSLWPAALPLAVRSPYFSCWLPTAQNENPLRQWPQFWHYVELDGAQTLGWAGLAIVDGTTYQWLGDWSDHPAPNVIPANLTGFEITPTRTILAIRAGAMELNVTFLTPVEPFDLVRQSLPFSYLALEATSIDGQDHDFQVYADISAEWLSQDDSSVVNWTTTQTDSIIYHEIQLTSPIPFNEKNGQANDGIMYHAISSGAEVSYQTGSDLTCRGQFQKSGDLDGSADTDFRAINSSFPVFPFAVDYGSISSTPNPTIWTLGYVRDPSIKYTTPDGNTQLRSPYFRMNFSTPAEFISFFLTDYDAASQRADALDQQILQAAATVSSDLADLVSLATRQVLGSLDITISNGTNGWNNSDIMIFMKNMGNDQRVNPVEVLYQAFPMFIYLNSAFGKALLTPLLEFQDSPQYTLPYAAADLGTTYPVVPGDNSAHDQMIEQTGNMLIMTLAYARSSGDGSLIAQHYNLLKSWANYLVNNTLDPSGQEQSADQIATANSTNLAIKGIIGIKAMAEMSSAMGDDDDAQFFDQQAAALVGTWESLALSAAQDHLLLAYGDEASWALAYNLYADRLLGTNLINSSIYEKQATFYQSLPEPEFGLGVDSSHTTMGNSAWLLFAAAAGGTSATELLISRAWDRASFNQTSGLFPTKFDTSKGTSTAGSASAGQGAMFAPLALTVANQTIVVTTPSSTSITEATKSANVGAIVGGVVGGVAVIGFAVIGILLWRRRLRQMSDEGEKADHSVGSPEPFPYSTMASLPPSSSQPVDIPGPSTHENPAYGQAVSIAPTSKMRELMLNHSEAQRRPNPTSSAASGSTQPASSREPPSSNSGGLSPSEVSELRTEVENLRRVMQEIQADRMEPPPGYTG